MQARIVAEAEVEPGEAIARYEEIEAGLGLLLNDEARAAIAWIEAHPVTPRVRPAGYRRVNLKIFRYFIAYIVREETIWVLAIAHGHRRPEFWRERAARIS
ncbi:MAG: type II toxin-antitoxin system RelE/ParE family toxin [Verrucomicrobia bacterium]|nr:type II toxin-antitoxin system RelE/ParE family toxin [Verrucomicrobiota bacterium]